MGLFNREKINEQTKIPVWFMRQAGRYHSHYQNIKKNSDFLTMCTDSDLATEVTMGPMNDFDFDAAILFSDLLFPLDHMGMNIQYAPGPKTDFLVKSLDDLSKLKYIKEASQYYQFQKIACENLRKCLPESKTLLGFVGAPFTLYSYAVEGSHSSLINAKVGLETGLYQGFLEKLLPSLWTEMDEQANGNIDAICLFDTAVGELCFEDFKTFILPSLKQTTSQFKAKHPNVKIIYYSRNTHMKYLQEIQDDNIDVLGVDWRIDITEALNTLGNDYMIQGNIDPVKLCLPWDKLEIALTNKWNQVTSSKVSLDKYIFGLGHGVLPPVPQENVLNAVKLIHERFRY